MIVNNAASRCDVEFWTKHLESVEENERAELKQIRGLRADTPREALEEMQRLARDNPRVKNFMYHADFNPCPHEHLAEADRDRAFEIFEGKRGIPKGTPRIVMEHVKNGRQHWHVIWFRLDEQGRPFSDKLDAKIAHSAARQIEKELGLEKVIGPFDREPGTPRPPRAPEAWEMYRSMKTGIDARDVKAEVTELRQQSENGKEFHAALEKHGYILAHGDRIVAGQRALMIIDPAGNDYHLPRYIAGMNSKQVNEFMRDVDRDALPTIQQAKAQQQERRIAGLEADRATIRDEIQWEEALAKAAIAKEEKERQFVEPQERTKQQMRAGQQERERHWPVSPPQHQSWPEFEKAATAATRDERIQDLRGPAAQVWAAWCEIDKDAALMPAQEEEARRLGVSIHEAREKVIAAALAGKTVSFAVPTKEAFAASLDDRGISFAIATKEEAERSHREAEFAKATGNRAPRFSEGEIVIVTEQRSEYPRDEQIIVPPRIHKLDQSLAEKFVKHLGTRGQLQGIDPTLKASDERAQQRRADREATRLERATNTKPPLRVTVKRTAANAKHNAKQGVHKSAAAIEKTISIAASFGKMFEIVGSLVEGIAAPKLTPQQIHEGEKAKGRREAEAENSIDFSRYTAEAAQQRQQQDNEREAARQRPRDEERGMDR